MSMRMILRHRDANDRVREQLVRRCGGISRALRVPWGGRVPPAVMWVFDERTQFGAGFFLTSAGHSTVLHRRRNRWAFVPDYIEVKTAVDAVFYRRASTHAMASWTLQHLLILMTDRHYNRQLMFFHRNPDILELIIHPIAEEGDTDF